MSQAPAHRSGGVDDALRAWRDETDRRRASFQQRAALYNAEQASRRARLLRWFAGVAVAVAGGACAVAVGVALAPYVAGAPADVRPLAAATPLPTLETPQLIQVSRTEVVPSTLVGLRGDVLRWQRDGALWIQFDYEGDPLTLRWRDADGREVLDATACENALRSGHRRCYVGRTAHRVQIARDAGAAAGVWTVDACRGGVCATVASYDVD